MAGGIGMSTTCCGVPAWWQVLSRYGSAHVKHGLYTSHACHTTCIRTSKTSWLQVDWLTCTLTASNEFNAVSGIFHVICHRFWVCLPHLLATLCNTIKCCLEEYPRGAGSPEKAHCFCAWRDWVLGVTDACVTGSVWQGHCFPLPLP